jgi:hypothetical protein
MDGNSNQPNQDQNQQDQGQAGMDQDPTFDQGQSQGVKGGQATGYQEGATEDIGSQGQEQQQEDQP